MLANLNTDTYGTATGSIAEVNGAGLFFTVDRDGEYVLHRTDGSVNGSEVVSQTPLTYQPSEDLFVVGDQAFFSGRANDSPYQLWVTDGTSAGTHFVTNIAQAPSFLGRQADVAYYSLPAGANQTGLWRTDGTAQGTFLVSTISQNSGARYLGPLQELGGSLYFVADSAATGGELWKVKSKDAGIDLVRDIVPGPTGSNARGLTRVGDALYFIVGSTSGNYQLWKSDGTESGTVPVFTTQPVWGDIVGLEEFDGRLAIFTLSGGSTRQLWMTDGSEAGTQLLTTFESNLGWYGTAVAGGRLFFSTRNLADNTELWVSDGTTAGTEIIQVNPDIQNGTNLTALDGRLYYRASEPDHGGELWTSDGTAEGTYRVLDLNPGEASSVSSGLTIANHRLYFNASDEHGTRHFYTSDGTAGGTQLVEGIELIEVGSYPFQFVSGDGKTFFVTWNGAPDSLWMTDGTTTTLLAENDVDGSGPYFFNVSGPDIPNYHFTLVGNSIVFIAATLKPEGEESIGMWRIDATGSAPVEIANFGPVLPAIYPLYFSNYLTVGDKVYFNGPNPSDPYASELWVTDGTAAGTMPLETHDGFAGNMTSLNGLLYFTNESQQLYVTDGTPAGTQPLLVSGLGVDTSIGLAAANSWVYFTAYDNAGLQLWKTDGTTTGTTVVKSFVENLTSTSGIAPMTAVNGRLYFVLTEWNGNESLWTSDGTAAGTVPVKTFPTAAKYPDLSNFSDLTAVGDLLYFTANDGVHGREVWRSDGTVASTYMLTDLNPVALTGSNAKSLVNFDGRLYWSANDGIHGQELWTTNGIAGGTHLVSDINPGSYGSDVDQLTASQGRLYFWADDGVHGAEPWYLAGNVPGDATGDGLVDGADYTAWADHFMRPGDWGFAQGDFNRDGAVNGADYVIWADHFLVAPASPPAAAALAATAAEQMPIASAVPAGGPSILATPAPRAEALEQRREIAGLASLRWAATVDRLFAQASAHDEVFSGLSEVGLLERLRRRRGG